MAVERTGAIYKSLFFDGDDSRDYGVYITGEAVYNAPEREVEMISIPGRSGQLALDKGRFENIEVTYPAGIYADNEADFAEAISNFRNLLCSKRGYVRLQDEYHPNEYRMAVYKSGLEVEPTMLKAGKFDIVFDCKPQRYLTSGEDPITMGDWTNVETVSGDIVEIDNSQGVLGVKSLSVELEPIQSGSGTPSPLNIRPIGGRTECVTEVRGKNLLNIADAEIGTAWNGTSNSARARLIIPLKPNTDYVLSMNGTMSVDGVYSVRSSVIPSPTTPSAVSFPRTINSGDNTYLTLGFNKTAISQSDVEALKLQLELGTTATDYEPYNGHTYTTTLGRTVYGADVEVVDGELVDKMGMVDLGDLNWSYNSTNKRFLAVLSSKATTWDMPNALCSAYQILVWGNAQGDVTKDKAVFMNGTHVSVRDTDYTDTTAFKTAMSGVQLCYELATPQTYQLTPTEVELLQGTNNVWSEGEVSVEYGTLPNVVINPTLFDASPLLLSNGYGDISIGDDTVTIEQTLVGEIQLLNSGATSASVNLANTEKLNAGDSIYEKKYSHTTTAETRLEISFKNIDNHPSNGVIATSGCTVTKYSHQNFTMEFDPALSFVYGTASQVNASFTIRVRINSSPVDVSFTASIAYDGNKKLTFTRTSSPATLPGTAYVKLSRYWGNFFGDSTKSALPNPLYIDLDLGEAYGDIGGSITSLNNAVRLPASLPKLKSGATTITYDGTITSLQVVPRWWKV